MALKRVRRQQGEFMDWTRRSAWIAVLAGLHLWGVAATTHAALVLDWDAVDYSQGSLSDSFDVGGVTVGIALSGDTNFVGSNPDDVATMTGGLSPAEESLLLLVNNSTNSEVLFLDVTFSTPVRDVSFSVFDIDTGSGGGSYHDEVTITGSLMGSSVDPVLTAVGSTFSIAGNIATGTAQAGNTTNQGTVLLSFLDPIDSFRIAYGNDITAPANPGTQGYGLHDVTFTSVPEPSGYLLILFALCMFGVSEFLKNSGRVQRS